MNACRGGICAQIVPLRDLQHDTHIESCRFVCRIDEKYDLSYSIGRMANSPCDTKRLSYIYVVHYRTFAYKVKPVFNDHPQDLKIVFAVGRWLLFGGGQVVSIHVHEALSEKATGRNIT